jgi:hypothetical protein
MDHLTLRRGSLVATLLAGLALGTLFTVGCASPGPPRAPSLHLPRPVSDLAASRSGNAVELRFTVPHLSTDKLPLYTPKHPGQVLRGTLCREVDHHDCAAIAGLAPTLTASDHTVLTLHDELDAKLATGPRHLLGYRVEFFGPDGRSAGKSEPAFTASGPIPAPVAGLRATGTRGGVLLQWEPAPSAQSDVLLQRTELEPHDKPDKLKKSVPQTQTTGRKSGTGNSSRLPAPRSEPEELWLNANSAATQTLDDTVIAAPSTCAVLPLRPSSSRSSLSIRPQCRPASPRPASSPPVPRQPTSPST